MLLKLLERIDRSQYEPSVISLFTKGEIGVRIEKLGICVEAMGMSPSQLPSITSLLSLIRKLRKIKPDIVHTWMYHADLIGSLAAKMARVKTVAWCLHNSNLDRN